MINIGDKVKVLANGPANRYHNMNGLVVEIIGECFIQEGRVLTFYHKGTKSIDGLGFGAMYEYGFEELG